MARVSKPGRKTTRPAPERPAISRRDFVAGGVAALTTLAVGCGRSEPQIGTPGPATAGAGRTLYDAIVIGAGLSGLHAAMILEEQGLSVLTLEGRNRIGGRVYTLDDIPGKPEAAGELIGGNYARMLDTARRLGLELFEPSQGYTGGEKLYHIRGQNIRADEWPEHELNPLSGDDRTMLPDRLLFVLSHRDNPLSGRDLDEWITPEFAKYDIPQSQYLREYLGFNEETIRLMNIVIHAEHMDTTSALHELRRYAVGEFNSKMSKDNNLPGALQVKGGNSLMAQAMADSLREGVLLEKTVYAFDDSGSEVTISCTDGSSYRAKQVVCSMPYPVMRHVMFTPRLPDRTASAIEEIDYGISIQVHFSIEREFWKEDGLPASMWTDAPFERFAVLNRGEGGTPSSAIAFINGDEANKYDFMDDETVGRFTLQELVKIRPSIDGALKPIHVQSCHRNVHGAGDWVYWQPGQVTQFAPHMREPHGNIHFAGEHTALMERGMEGAFESGERAAFDILTRA